jgi:hypothetical protein
MYENTHALFHVKYDDEGEEIETERKIINHEYKFE